MKKKIKLQIVIHLMKSLLIGEKLPLNATCHPAGLPSFMSLSVRGQDIAHYY